MPRAVVATARRTARVECANRFSPLSDRVRSSRVGVLDHDSGRVSSGTASSVRSPGSKPFPDQSPTREPPRHARRMQESSLSSSYSLTKFAKQFSRNYKGYKLVVATNGAPCSQSVQENLHAA